MIEFGAFCRRHASGMLLAASVALGSSAAMAQMRTVDPNAAIDGDLAQQQDYPEPTYESGSELPPADASTPAYPAPAPAYPAPVPTPAPVPPAAPAPIPPAAPATAPIATAQGDTFHRDDLIGAAEDVFGKGAEGLARMIEDVLARQGEPNGYIVGREAGGAFILGVRYGSGTLFHKIEGQRPVYWTGPSVGFDAGANAGKTFVLVYNLYDSEQLYERYPAGGGDAYIVGGLTASYLRKGDTVLIPIRMGAGLRLGVNAGYMKFSKEQKWLPF